MQTIELLASIMGVLMSLAYFPQAHKIFKNKSSKNLSFHSYLTFAIGTFIWAIYGIYKHDYIIVTSFTLGVIGSWSVLLGILLYRK